MSEAAHTPGPWEVRKWHNPMSITGNIHQVTDRENYPCAFIPAWDAPLEDQIDGTEEAKANARLIAAAPDLLEALEPFDDAARDRAADASEWKDGDTVAVWVTIGDLRKARAAIARAKGSDT